MALIASLDNESPDSLAGMLMLTRLRITDDPSVADVSLSVADAKRLEEDYELWLRTLFPGYVSDPEGNYIPLAEHHHTFWHWVWAMQRASMPDPFVAVWSRGGAKSTSAELATAALGARKARRYILYVSRTQDRANDHVQNIGALLETKRFQLVYPETGAMAISMLTGVQRGWKRSRLMTSDKFKIDAIGLDAAVRGIKIEDDRPDCIMIDDIDDTLDSPGDINRRFEALTKALIPSGATNVAILAIQNLVHARSIFSRLVTSEEAFLAGRIISGPIKAINDLRVQQEASGRWTIIGGEATWPGQSVPICQRMMDRMGYSAFMSECQHEITRPAGGRFQHIEWPAIRVVDAELPELVRTVCWVDPAITETDRSDANAIQIDSLGTDDTIYRRYSWEERASPLPTLKLAIAKALEFHAECVGVETDQGGDTWIVVFDTALEEVRKDLKSPLDRADWPSEYSAVIRRLRLRRAIESWPKFRQEKAGSSHQSKTHRLDQMLAEYEHGRFRHVIGPHHVLEAALDRFPIIKPFDLCDAAFWSFRDLVPITSEEDAFAPGVVSMATARGW